MSGFGRAEFFMKYPNFNLALLLDTAWPVPQAIFLLSVTPTKPFIRCLGALSYST
jgi:hypothetical protein